MTTTTVIPSTRNIRNKIINFKLYDFNHIKFYLEHNDENEKIIKNIKRIIKNILKKKKVNVIIDKLLDFIKKSNHNEKFTIIKSIYMSEKFLKIKEIYKSCNFLNIITNKILEYIYDYNDNDFYCYVIDYLFDISSFHIYLNNDLHKIIFEHLKKSENYILIDNIINYMYYSIKYVGITSFLISIIKLLNNIIEEHLYTECNYKDIIKYSKKYLEFNNETMDYLNGNIKPYLKNIDVLLKRRKENKLRMCFIKYISLNVLYNI